MLLNSNLEKYSELLLKWQKTINLVSPSTLEVSEIRHFKDSLQLLDFIPVGTKSICDIGSGAGFPGLVIAIMRPDINVTLIEADARKCAFLQTVSRETNCKNVKIFNDRIENVIGEIEADCLTARALASLRQLINFSTPLWKTNKKFTMILPKGANFETEIDEAYKSYTFEIKNYPSVTDELAKILIVNKIAPL